MGLLALRTVPSEYVYAFRGQWSDLLGSRQHYDVVIHAIALVNHSPKVVSAESITLDATHRGRLLQRVVFDQEEIQQRARPVVAREQFGLRPLVHLILGTDQALSAEEKLSSSAELEPGHVLVLPNTFLMFHKRPDSLRIRVQFRVDGVEDETQSELRIAEHASRVKYTFPLQGAWFMKGTPSTGVYDHHRFGVSNEFGADLLRLGPQGELFKNDGKQSADYYSYGEKVLAAAEGRVVAVNNAQTQDWSRFNPKQGETEEQFQERQMHQVREALQGDVASWAAGNYILIEHAQDEYSAYLHLRENSATVRAGDVVRRGQHIADVGNTGDSFGAHLHFQVLDRPDLVHGRSLPFEFEGIVVTLSEPGWLVQAAG